jgi:hypothetical protein
MGTASIKLNKKTALFLATALMGLLSCAKNEAGENDFEPPKLTVLSPQEGQVFAKGDTIHIVAEALHEYAWGIYDTAGVIVPSQFGLVHDEKRYTIRGSHVVGGIATTTLWTVWVHSDDERDNYDDYEINIIVSP